MSWRSSAPPPPLPVPRSSASPLRHGGARATPPREQARPATAGASSASGGARRAWWRAALPGLGEEREEGLEDGQRCRLRKEGVREVEKTKSSIYRCARNWVFLGQRVGTDLPRRLS